MCSHVSVSYGAIEITAIINYNHKYQWIILKNIHEVKPGWEIESEIGHLGSFLLSLDTAGHEIDSVPYSL